MIENHENEHFRRREPHVDSRVVFLTLLCVALAIVATIVAQVLTSLIGLITNLAFYGTISTNFTSPAQNTLGLWVVMVPICGATIVGLIACFGSKAIRGHGIPEAMEQVLLNESKIPARLIILKPASAAIAIGTGGPFGAEGPIIATGGALGSWIGQLIHTTANERKTLLAAGAAAGMTATFGSPVSAVLLAIELLLFEFKARSIIPVALAAATAAAFRNLLAGPEPVFLMPQLQPVSALSLPIYLIEGAILGLIAVVITKSVYWIEDKFECLPIHWMWWPAIGGAFIGAIGYVAPHTLGVGYDNIQNILSGEFVGIGLISFCALKFISWAIALGSGTSGGTLAPLFTIGGGFGSAIGTWLSHLAPNAHIDIRVAALVGMAATFTGASRALLASIVFAFETTQQPHALVPLLGACSLAYLVSALLMQNSIMTEKLARRGHHVPTEFVANH